MNWLDTNVLVRAVVADDPEHARVVSDVLDSDQHLVSPTVVLETVWVLESCYELPREAVVTVLRRLLGFDGLVLVEPARISAAVAWYATGMDFADALHLGAVSAGESFLTFDRKLTAAARRLEDTPEVRRLG